MRVEDLLVYGKRYCHSDHVKLLLSDLLNLNPLELLNHLNDMIEEDKTNLFKKEIESLKEGKPLQYVIGNVNFYGNSFLVNEHVLIPRFETEELVENTMNYIKQIFSNNQSLRILDIGCGSGVIGLTLKKHFPNATLDLLDISPEALIVAKENAKRLNLEVNFIESDVFQKVDHQYDVIISNPPYIKTHEEIETIVKDNEPHLALYAGEDGLDVYRKILKDIEKYIKEKSLIALEIGQDQKQEIMILINNYLDDQEIEVKKDLSGRDRMIFITKGV